MMAAVCGRFGLPMEMPASVRAADEIVLATEARDLMPHHGEAGVPLWRLTHQPLDMGFGLWAPADARRQFLARFHELTTATEAA